MGRSRDVTQAALLKNARIRERVGLFSPMTLYAKASATLIDPMRNTTRSLVLMGPLERISASRFRRALPLGQSLVVVYPHLAALIGLTLVCFGLSYTVFIVQEIR